MNIEIRVQISLERIQGKFASKDEMIEQIIEALVEANPGEFVGENDGEYQVQDWDAEVVER